jgi:MFS family permease
MPKLMKKFSIFGGISRALSNRNYRIYWSGQVVMVQGFWIYKIVAGWFMWEMTNSSAWLGTLAAAYMLPVLFLGPFGGAVADRYGYRNVAIIMGSFGALMALVTAALTWMEFMTPFRLVCLAIFQGSLFAFEFPARQSLFPLLVDRTNMAAAVAVNSTTFHSSGFTGPLLGGILLTLGDTMSGVSAGFIANAFCMGWMMIALSRITSPQKENIGSVDLESTSLIHDLLVGLKYAYSYTDLRLLLLLSLFASLFIRPYLDFLPGFSDDVFNRGKEGLTILTAVSGVGSMAFAIFFAIRGRAKGLVSVLFFCQIGCTIALILFSLLDQFLIALLALSLVGGLLVSSSIAAQSLIQQAVADRFRARVISLNVSLAIGAPALSALTLGWAAEYIGLQLSLTGSGVLGLIITIPLTLALIKRRKEIEAERN